MDESMANPDFANGLAIGMLVAVVFMLATMWRLFSKAGESGWKALVPVYGAIVFQRILGRPAWWVALMMIPVVNIAIAIIECFDLAKVYGKGTGYALGLMFLGPIFALILAFGPAKYVGPGGKPTHTGPTAMPYRPTSTATKAPITRKAA